MLRMKYIVKSIKCTIDGVLKDWGGDTIGKEKCKTYNWQRIQT